MASGEKIAANQLAKNMKQELTDAVVTWTDADLARAKGMDEGILMRGLPMSPLYFNEYWPLTDSLQDRTFMAAYWPMKTGQVWDSAKLLAQMCQVPLPVLKQSALDIVGSALPHEIPGRG